MKSLGQSLLLRQNHKAMMTKEEVAQVVAYCDENKISYKRFYWLRKKVFGKMSEKNLPVDTSVPIQVHLV